MPTPAVNQERGQDHPAQHDQNPPRNTLKVTVPALTAGPVQVKVTNPDGTSYTVDAGFVAQ
jgi:hypothetical protein